MTDARQGDRLCVYDLNDNAEDGETPRHQFGCEVIVAGDADLVMTRDITWRPQITIQQTGPQQLGVNVRQALTPSAALFAQVIPEFGNAYPAQALLRTDDEWNGVFDLPVPVTPLFLQVWVDEMPATPTTCREVVADRGTGGNGAFGPVRVRAGAMVVSSDGAATYEGAENALTELGAGESIAWQNMPGTPALPLNRFISGQSYRLDAFPAALVAGGTVSIQFENAFGARSACRRQQRTLYLLLEWHSLDRTPDVAHDACQRPGPWCRRQRLSGLRAEPGRGCLCGAERSGRQPKLNLSADDHPVRVGHCVGACGGRRRHAVMCKCLSSPPTACPCIYALNAAISR